MLGFYEVLYCVFTSTYCIVPSMKWRHKDDRGTFQARSHYTSMTISPVTRLSQFTSLKHCAPYPLCQTHVIPARNCVDI